MPDPTLSPRGFLSPAVRRIAHDLGVDPRTVVGSGAGGRVTVHDVEEAARGHRPQPAPARGATGSLPITVAERPGDERRPLNPMRRRAAANLRASVDTAVHALVAVEVDYAAVDRARTKSEADGRPFTYLPFVARATVDAIRRYPEVNAVLDGDELVVRRAVNLGIAVDLDHDGLVVPVIPDADAHRLDALADHVRDLARRARSRKLTPDDVTGGTFSITNAGRYGTFVTGPIINLPQVAILSMNGVRARPVAVEQPGGGYAVGVHPVGSLSLSFDHRAFDGAYASAFLAEVRDILESRDWEAEL